MKRLLGVLLCLVLLMSIGSPAFAAAGAYSLSIDNATAKQGDTVTLEVVVVDNPGISAVGVEFNYDKTAFDSVTIEGDSKWEIYSTYANWAEAKDSYATGLILTITAKIAEDATPGEYAISCIFTDVINRNEEEIPASASGGKITVTCSHQPVIKNYKAATCTTPGYTGDEVCAVCEEFLKAGESIPAGHTEVIDPAVEATCTEPGKTEGKHCSECDEVFIEQTIVNALGHDFVDGVCTRCGEPDTAIKDYLTFSGASPFTLATGNNTKNWDGTMYYSTDAVNWSEWDGTEISSSKDGKLYLHGSGNTIVSGRSANIDRTNRFVLTGSGISCDGNIETLLDYETVSRGEHPQMGEYCYNALFFNCSSLVSAPELPATELVKGCYYGLFYKCASLTEAPELPATTAAEGCYASMFRDCTSLTTAPELPATTLAKGCYANMFDRCTSLTTAPELPATVMADSCYGEMFRECTSLTTAPELPATVLADRCYNGMFYACAALTAAPVLPATTLAEECYYSMFEGCKGLKISTTPTAECPYEWRIPSEGTINSEPSAWNTFMIGGTGGSFTDIPDINTIYYVSWNTGITHVHNWDDGEVTTAPSCTVAGVRMYRCTGCGETKTEPVAPNGHTEVIDSAVEATCTESGKTDGKHCSVCNAVIVAQHPVPAKGHTEVIDAAVEATCTEPGKTEGKHCSVCNAVIKAQQTVPANGHTEVTDTAVEPTCTEPGKTEGKHCSVCGAFIVAQQPIAPKGHQWDSGTVTTEPSCTAEGVKTFHCTACDAVKTEGVDALGHSFADGKCTRCDAPEGYLIKLTLPSADLDGINVWVDGVEYPATVIGGELCARIPHTDAKTAVVNVFNSSTGDIHTQYPVGMYVWTLRFEGDEYNAEYIPEMDNLLQYAGMSIRVPAYGIRMISSVPDELRSSGLAGYTLEEYGTQVKGPNNTISATAYKRDAQDSVYKQSGGRTFYTNVLVDFPTKEDCLKELNMRPYVVLSKDGETITLYGGWVQRSIWYVATQNKDAFPEGSEYDNFIEQIISYKEG